MADLVNQRIQKFPPNSTMDTPGITVAGGNGKGSGAHQLNNPNGVFVDAEGAIFIADTENDRVQKWNIGASFGTTVAGGNGRGSSDNQLSAPWNLFIRSDGTIYVADTFNHRIQKFQSNSTSVTDGFTVAGGAMFGNGSDLHQLNFPTSVQVDAAGTVYACDSGNDRIQKFIPRK